jgi:hypothetical protein
VQFGAISAVGQRLGQHPGDEAFAVTFQTFLHDLIGLNCCAVSVAVSDSNGHPTMVCAGELRGAVDVLGADANDHEVLFFPLDDMGDAGFLIAQAAFTGAAWDDGVLHVELGGLTLMIEPSDT